MSTGPRFVGRQGKHAMRKHREKLRIEAEVRNEEYQAKLKADAKAETAAILADKNAMNAIAEAEASKS